MNEISLLRSAGPEAEPVSDDVLRAARASLLTEIRAASDARSDEPASVLAARQLVEDARSRGPAPRRRRPGRRAALRVGAAVLTAVAAAAVALLVPDAAPPAAPPAASPAPSVGAPRPDDVTLVSFEVPAFPLTLSVLPPGAGDPVFGADRTGASASYPDAQDDGDDLNIYVGSQPPPPAGSSSFPDSAPEDVTVNGSPAVLVESADPVFASLDWQRAPGQYVTMLAQGGYAQRDVLLSIAEGMVDGPQAVPVQLHLAPAGYSLDFTKDDGRVVSLSDDTRPDRGLIVRLLDSGDGDLAQQFPDVAGQQVEVPVQGRPAQLARSDLGGGGAQGWVLQARLPDGTDFVMEAPGDLTQQQVVQLADQVSSTP